MSDIKAIETSYRGFRFRSRLEARWAVFFDAMKWAWRYEPQGYEFGGETYLPDFWVPQLSGWIEVKGALDVNGMERLISAAMALPTSPDGGEVARRRPVLPKLLILGEIPDPSRRWAHMHLGVDANRAPTWRYSWLCPSGAIALADWNYAEQAPDPSMAAWFGGCHAPWIRRDESIAAAYAAARSARFEHGVSGAG